MIHIVWEFLVKPGAIERFEQVYGPDGDWARLFSNHPGFRGTSLLPDERSPRRYFSIDAWETTAHRRRMLSEAAAEYADLDAAAADLTESEREIGTFVSVEPNPAKPSAPRGAP